MSKFVKSVVIISCLLFFAGLLLALTSLALGANPYVVGDRLNSMGVSEAYLWGHERVYRNAMPPQDIPDIPAFPAAPFAPFAPFAPDAPQPGEYDIKSLYFDFEVGDITIKQGEDFALIYGGNRAQHYFYERIEDSTWTIGSNKHWHFYDLWRHNGDRIKLTVVLPADFVAGRMDINMGAGNMVISSLYAQELYLDVGLGNCQIGELLARDADLNVGLGNLAVYSFHADDSRLEVGVGAMRLDLARPLSDYRGEVSVGLGDVTIGKNSYSGVANLNTGSVDSAYKMDINCGLGSITVKED